MSSKRNQEPEVIRVLFKAQVWFHQIVEVSNLESFSGSVSMKRSIDLLVLSAVLFSEERLIHVSLPCSVISVSFKFSRVSFFL